MPAHDVFVSYASEDKAIADAIVARLESRGVRCWYAPRDVIGGMSYATAIVDAIRRARVMVFVLSDSSNRSDQVTNEVERAVHHKLTIVPFRIDPVEPSGDLEYFVSRKHWLDALPPPAKTHVERLAETVELLLKHAAEQECGGSMPTSGLETVRSARRRLRFGVAALAIVLIAGVGWYFSQGPSDAEVPRATTSSAADSVAHRPSAEEPERSGFANADTKGGSSLSDADEQPDRGSAADSDSGKGEKLPVPVDAHDTLDGEGRLGFGGASRKAAKHRVSEDGRLSIGLFNRTAAGSQSARLETFAIDGRQEGGCVPGRSRDSGWFTVRKGQEVTIEVGAPADHSVVYELEPRFKGLEELGPVPVDEDGLLDGVRRGRLGFDGRPGDDWTYRAAQDGRLQIHISNLIPLKTELARLETFTIDGRSEGGCLPGRSRDSAWFTVRQGQEVKIEVGAPADHSVVYELEPRFKGLGELGPVAVAEDRLLDGVKSGRLGFDGKPDDDWTYRAAQDGRLQIHVSNVIPVKTELALLETFTIDGRREPGCLPGRSRDSAWFTVRQGQEVKIEVHAPVDHSVVYELEPRFKGLAELGPVPVAEDGLLDGAKRGRLGFDSKPDDDWTYRAAEDGRLQVHVSNLIPVKTELALLETFTIDGRREHACLPGRSSKSAWLTVRQGQEVRIRVGAPAGHSVVYEMTPEFETAR